MQDHKGAWRYTLSNRIWHWLLVLVVLGILYTLSVRLLFFGKVHIAGLITQFLSERGVSLSEADSFVLAKIIGNVVWQWHVVLGHILAILFLFKIAHMAYFRYIHSEVSTDKLGKVRNGMSHLILTLLLVMALSGELMVFLPYHNALVNIAYQVHAFCGLYLFPPVIVLHIVLVVYLEVKSKSFRGSVSKMIGGDKNE